MDYNFIDFVMLQIRVRAQYKESTFGVKLIELFSGRVRGYVV